jgi:hypothetical protein
MVSCYDSVQSHNITVVLQIIRKGGGGVGLIDPAIRTPDRSSKASVTCKKS